jgi:regulator of replication initiation timing
MDTDRLERIKRSYYITAEAVKVSPMKDDMQWLLDEITRLQGEVERLRKQLEEQDYKGTMVLG